MERLYLLAKDYSSKWRHILSKQKFCEEFGKLEENEIIAHNFKVLENHHLLMDLIQKLNQLDLDKLTDDDKEFIQTAIEATDNLDEKDFIAII